MPSDQTSMLGPQPHPSLVQQIAAARHGPWQQAAQASAGYPGQSPAPVVHVKQLVVPEADLSVVGD